MHPAARFAMKTTPFWHEAAPPDDPSGTQPPEAVDDSFAVLEGRVLDVTADDINLLSNDSDDIDVRNRPLRVLTQPARSPAAASSSTTRR